MRKYTGAGVAPADRTNLYTDARGSIVLRAGATGATPEINSYDEYGQPATTNVGRFQYTGQAWLPELGMYYYKARIYSPRLGRFMQTDPIGYEDQYNLYAYVGNDPINGTDPTGKWAHILAGGIIGGGVGLVTEVAAKVATGGDITAGSVSAAILGGATSGATLAGTGNPTLAAAAGSAVQSTTQQIVDNGSVDLTKVATDTAIGTVVGRLPTPKVPGITSGNGSMAHVASTQMTKLRNGTSSRISQATAAKMGAAEVVSGGVPTAVGAALDKGGVTEAATDIVSEIVVTAERPGWFKRNIVNPVARLFD